MRGRLGVLAIAIVACVTTGALFAGEASTHPPVAFHAHDHSSEHQEGASAADGEGAGRTMMLAAIYCSVIVLASVAGGYLPRLFNLTHTRMQLLMSLVGGLMLGISVLHLLPHGIVILGPERIDQAAWWMLLGMMAMFFLLRLFHFHQHGPLEHDQMEQALGPADGLMHDHDHDHGGEGPPGKSSGTCSHGHHGHGAPAHRLSWLGVAVGLSVHTLIDGVALGTAIRAEAGHSLLAGLGPFLAIMLHKPLDAVSITTLMAAGGWSKSAQNLVNLVFASMCPLGALLFLFGVQQIAGEETLIVGCSLAFSAGVFLCISLGDLLPEMEFHSHNRVQLSVALVVGVLIAWGIGFLEPEHVHQAGSSETRGHLHRH